MLLQTVPLQLSDACSEAEMYFRVSGGTAEYENGALRVSCGAELSFDTYFGSFMPRVWMRRTAFSGLSLRIKISGHAELHIMRLCPSEGGAATREVIFRELDLSGEETEIDFGIIHPDGLYYFRLSALDDIKLMSAEYHCPDEPLNTDVHINAVICTYRREKCVAATLKSLSESVLKNTDSPLHGRLNVTLVDNAGTLNARTSPDGSITVITSPNLGGAGGFTRGILEALEHSDTTHVLLMDDDAAVMPRSLEIIFAFLSLVRPEHSDLSIAGALLRSDLPWYQYEAGAQWNGGHIIQNGHGLDLRSQDDLLECAAENSFIDYAGWWFACMPVSQIKRIGLPMPFFLHRDDVEYGLRCSGRFVALPGACVWHEAMESKLSGLSEYYDLRNLFITNAIHCPDFSLVDYRNMLRKWYLRNLFAHRYRYIDMNLAGVRDALRGIDWLLEQDTRELHKRIAQMNYTAAAIKKLDGAKDIENISAVLNAQRELRKEVTEPNLFDKAKKALTVLLDGGLRLPAKRQTILAVQPAPIYAMFRSGRVIHCDWHGKGFSVMRDKEELKRCREKYLRLLDILDVRFEDARAGYSERWQELCSEENWRRMLGMEKKS